MFAHSTTIKFSSSQSNMACGMIVMMCICCHVFIGEWVHVSIFELSCDTYYKKWKGSVACEELDEPEIGIPSAREWWQSILGNYVFWMSQSMSRQIIGPSRNDTTRKGYVCLETDTLPFSSCACRQWLVTPHRGDVARVFCEINLAIPQARFVSHNYRKKKPLGNVPLVLLKILALPEQVCSIMDFNILYHIQTSETPLTTSFAR